MFLLESMKVDHLMQYIYTLNLHLASRTFILHLLFGADIDYWQERTTVFLVGSALHSMAPQ